MRRLSHAGLILAVILLVNCTTELTDKLNQQGLQSPSGRYVVNVPIERDARDHHEYWRVTISNANGSVLFKDDSNFVGNLNVYWYWDKNDRLWLVSSDNGNICYWEVDKNGNWQRTQWHEDGPGSLKPPPELFPEYWPAKK